MNTTCERCGAPRSTSRPGLSTARCEQCERSHTAPAAAGEGSGLIDIRALATMLGDRPIRPVTPVPTYGGLAPLAASLTPPPRAEPRRPSPVRASQTPLYVLLGVLVFGVVGLAGAAVHSATRTAPQVSTLVITSEAPAGSVAAEHAEHGEHAEDAADEAAAPEASDEPETTAETGKPEAPRKPSRPAARPGKPEVAKPGPKPAPVVEVAKGPRADSVECLLDPSSCAPKRAAPAAAAAVASPVAAPATSDLPAKLEPADISDGTRAAKASATSRCSNLAKGGETVKIKLSIAGPSGSVISTAAEANDGNPALANCCASELKAAQFKPVQKQQIGAVVTLKF